MQRGGLKLKDRQKTGFTPVYDMIEKGTLSLLTYSSLKGFMINLEVPEEYSEYLALNKSIRFETPVTNFILKFAVITPLNDMRLDRYKNKSKSSESKQSFFEEAKLQQYIWKTSIAGGKPEICPPVANFSLFDNVNSRYLLDYLKGKTSRDTREVFDYLLDQVNGYNSGIGIIVMPKIENSDTLHQFVLNNDETSANQAYACVIAQIVKLFIIIKVIHFDLHRGNALIYWNPDSVIESYLIDFGRASFMNDNNYEYLDSRKKTQCLEEGEKYFKEMFSLIHKSDAEKGEFMLKVIKYIADRDLEENGRIFNKTRPQMNWYASCTDDVFQMAFDKLIEITISDSTRMGNSTITSYENNGSLIKFRDISEFEVPFLPRAPSRPPPRPPSRPPPSPPRIPPSLEFGTLPGPPSGTYPITPSGIPPSSESGTLPGPPSGTYPRTPSGFPPGPPESSESETLPGPPSGTYPRTPSGFPPGPPESSESETLPGPPSGTYPITPSGIPPGPPESSESRKRSRITARGPERGGKKTRNRKKSKKKAKKSTKHKRRGHHFLSCR